MELTKLQKPVNIVIVGTGMYVCGRGTDTYGTILPAMYEWKKRGKLGNVSVAGTRPEGINVLKEKNACLKRLYGFEIDFRYYPDSDIQDTEAYRKAIRDIPQPACAVVVVPDELHRKVAGEVIEKGFHSLVVKPLAPTVAEVKELIALQAKHRVYCAVEFHKRFDRSNMKLRDAVVSGKIGQPLYSIIEYSQRKSIPTERFKNWVKSINIFQYLGIHYVDIIHFITSALPLRVMAIGQKKWLCSKGLDIFDSIQVIVEWGLPTGDAFTSSFFTNWIDPENTSAMSDQKIKVIGTKGRYEADQKARGITMVTDERGIEEINPDFCSRYGTADGEISFQGYGIISVLQFLEDVENVVSGTVKINELEGRRPTFRDAVIPTVVIEAVNRSLDKNGEWIQTKFTENQFVGFE
ncbi:MAG: Gfo/Idh/MocA family oxidoreductase [Candidatus Brocadiaceae bacterium]|nr:Gfo/Idh/MocA family oxidoreductase [Candidatus Brocadiaceae bacterium]